MTPEILQRPIIDPSKSSLIEGVLDLELEKKTGFYFDKQTGERFRKIDSEKIKNQRLATLLMKGVINVADIVKVGNDYYCHFQNFDHLEASKEDIIAETDADAFIISAVFSDDDHAYFPGDSEEKKRTEHGNLIIDEREGKLVFFDFDKAFHDMLNQKEDSLALEKFFNELIRNFKLNHKFLKLNYDISTMMHIVVKKVSALHDLYESGGLEGFLKIAQKSGTKLNEQQQKILFENIQLRLKIFAKVLSEMK